MKLIIPGVSSNDFQCILFFRFNMKLFIRAIVWTKPDLNLPQLKV